MFDKDERLMLVVDYHTDGLASRTRNVLNSCETFEQLQVGTKFMHRARNRAENIMRKYIYDDWDAWDISKLFYTFCDEARFKVLKRK